VSEQRPSDVLGALPRRRPHRRSDKRAPAAASAPAEGAGTTRTRIARLQQPAPARKAPSSRAAAPKTAASKTTAPKAAAPRARPQRLAQPAQPAGVPATPRRRPTPSGGRHLVATAAQAAAELAEIGLSVSARTLRSVVDRLPRP
jgi:hypothetical protein